MYSAANHSGRSQPRFLHRPLLQTQADIQYVSLKETLTRQLPVIRISHVGHPCDKIEIGQQATRKIVNFLIVGNDFFFLKKTHHYLQANASYYFSTFLVAGALCLGRICIVHRQKHKLPTLNVHGAFQDLREEQKEDILLMLCHLWR